MNACNLLQKHSCWGQLIRKRTSEPRGTINRAPSTCSPEPTGGIINKPVPVHHKVQTGLEAKKRIKLDNWGSGRRHPAGWEKSLGAVHRISVSQEMFHHLWFQDQDWCSGSWNLKKNERAEGLTWGWVLPWPYFAGKKFEFLARAWADRDMDVWPCTALTRSTEQLKD